MGKAGGEYRGVRVRTVGRWECVAVGAWGAWSELSNFIRGKKLMFLKDSSNPCNSQCVNNNFGDLFRTCNIRQYTS